MTRRQRETLPIAGFALDGNDWDGIYVVRRKGKDLVYVGKVDHGFDKKSAADLRKRLTPLIRKTPPYAKRIAHKGIWVEPELLAEIRIPSEVRGGQGPQSLLQGPAGGSVMRTVWMYVDPGKPVGDIDHLKVFADEDSARQLFRTNDPEGVAFEYPVEGA